MLSSDASLAVATAIRCYICLVPDFKFLAPLEQGNLQREACPASPAHCLPPLDGGGFEHRLVRSLMPIAQVFFKLVQFDHADHWLHCPLTTFDGKHDDNS